MSDQKQDFAERLLGAAYAAAGGFHEGVMVGEGAKGWLPHEKKLRAILDEALAQARREARKEALEEALALINRYRYSYADEIRALLPKEEGK